MKENKNKNKDQKEHGGTDAIAKAWELNVFTLHLSYVFST